MRRGPAMGVLAAVLAGCFAPAPGLPPFAPPSVGRDLRCWRGTPLSGPRAFSALATLGPPESALHVVMRFVALEELPDGRALSPLPVEARMVAALGSGTPLLSVSREAQGARVGEVRDTAAVGRAAVMGELGRSATLGQSVAALPVGVTVSAHLSRDLTRPPGLPPAREAVALMIGRSEDGKDLDVGILIDSGLSAPRDEPQGELHLLQPFRERDSLELAVVIPSPFDQDRREADGTPRPRSGILGLISVSPAPGPGTPGHATHRQAHATCLGDLARTAVIEERVDLDPDGLPTPPGKLPLQLAVLRSRLADPSRSRSALLELAYFTRAGLTGEAALSLDDQLASRLARDVATALDRPGAPGEAGRALAWLLERATASLLAEEPGEPLSRPAVDALLARHIGALGVLQADLRAALAAEGLSEWRERVLRGNLTALGDGRPGVRLRAFEWLQARNAAPTGYDPLGPLDERAAALPVLQSGDEE